MPIRRYGGSASANGSASKNGSSEIAHKEVAKECNGVAKYDAVHKMNGNVEVNNNNNNKNSHPVHHMTNGAHTEHKESNNTLSPTPYTLRSNAYQWAVYDGIKDTPPLPELQEPQVCKEYCEVDLTDSLYKLVDANDIIMVAGAFFGDEGKGKTVDAVAHHPKCTCIARVNSGENAGHTVFDEHGRKFVFNLCPSGMLTEGKRNYIGPECVMDPISFLDRELAQLSKLGIDYHDQLFLGNVCIVTPYHKLLDLLGSAANASTLKGISPVHASKATKRGIRLDHIFNDEQVLRERLTKDMETYLGLLSVLKLTDRDVVERCMRENSDGVSRVPDYVIDFAQAKDKVQFLVDLYHSHVRENAEFPKRCDVIHELQSAILRGEKVLLEGPQSYWLSNAREKFWESTTSADTSAAGLLATSQLNFQRFKSVVINVHKAPGSSRVGLGACPSGFVPQDYFSSRSIKTLKDLPAGMCVDFDVIQRLYFNHAFNYTSSSSSSSSSSIAPEQSSLKTHDKDKVTLCRANPYNGIAAPIEYTDSTGTYNIGVAMAVGSAIHHGECGAVTKKPRVCGLFDCVLHYEVNAVQGPYLTISALDRGDEYDKVGITIAYVYFDPANKTMNLNGKIYQNGDIIKAGDAVPGEAALHYCHPIVKLIDGWRSSPISSALRPKFAPLPRGVCEFISTVEYFTGCKVLSIGNGPSGNDVIYLSQ